ncbi:hypothetical protein [Oryzisolibacter sp. LB2S]|uniref:hypothetical protein n=1 Tax=Alicycliphilus soli TaxID=3228789 RepID=UPI00345869D2
MPASDSRLRFAVRYALRHLLISLVVALASAALVYGLLYPQPWQTMLGVGSIFVLLLGVDVVCGPLLTLILASPRKSLRERWLDFSLVGLVQLAALLYGLHSLWLARPVVLAFETDRLVIVTAPEVQTDHLPQAPAGLQRLPWWGVQQVGTRKAAGSDEFMRSVELGLQGISPAMRPDWWQPWPAAQAAMNQRAKPITELLARRPQDAATLQAAIDKTGLAPAQLRYLPLTSSKTKDWVALLDEQLHIVGYAPVDGFLD